MRKIILLLIISSCTYSTDKGKIRDRLNLNNLVPDDSTAIRIAETIWTPLYGVEKMESEKPFKAKLMDSVWCVTGTSFSKTKYEYKEGKKILRSLSYTNVAYIFIDKRDGRILSVGHGK